jgi:two-component system, cell cycle response regulator DivK
MSRRILVVEDDLDNLRIAEKVLAREGYEVATAGDAPAAFEALAAAPPALVLLDLDLPGLSGFEALVRIRAEDAWRKIPILALTALAHRDDEARARRAGCDDYLTKPCRPETLRERVRHCLGD